MLKKFLAFALLCVFTSIIYKIPFFRKFMVLNSSISLYQLFGTFILPLQGMLVISMTMIEILLRPNIHLIRVEDSVILMFFHLLMTMLLIGVGIHILGKIITDYLRKHKETKTEVYKLNRYFHGPLSHSFIYVCAVLLAFVLSIFEINHPNIGVENLIQFMVIGVLMGCAYALTVNYYGYPNRYFIFLVLVTIVDLSLVYLLNLNIYLYPYLLTILSSFISSVCFFILFYILRFVFKIKYNRKF